MRARDITVETARRPAVILAPHADDETLGCGGVIALKRASGTAVTIFMATDGSASHRFEQSLATSREALVRLREDETRKACATLGVDRASVEFARLPDGRLEDHIAALAQSIRMVIERVDPAEIFVCAERDGHPDHQALAKAARRALRYGSYSRAVLFEYPVWSYDFRSWRPHGMSNRRGYLKALEAMIGSAKTWRMRSVDISSVQAQKAEALAAHRSQLGSYPPEPYWTGLPASFLRHFQMDHELFREIRPEEFGR
ncbi:PIG-L family deacetylase [Marivita sp. GX14005]|uniref:PIG-L deacetylase family protein n=1 Tax=Marivita sp. GX14005 TaxID=2942276 RepID=UPI002018999B|nr:PIG-L family deacetylase [Marivita sp. GX14005]MCL3881747.1 PIG-L family deacetylase [Marivita sp. GX14005]